ncbi:MAG TPA: glycosyltransferase family 9 protein [Burkholderiales bacterium]|nr:glycosyltransferase family 9 protein [Burkholderiales bacterium]
MTVGDAPPDEVLIVVTRRIGDVLLATPLIRSLRNAWPRTAIDVLVFEGTQGALTANADIRRVLTVAQRPGARGHLALLATLARRYALALSLVPGDRPTLYAFIAGRRRAGLLIDSRKERWKQKLLHAWVPFDNLNTHTVRMHLALAHALGVPAQGDVHAGWSDADARQVDVLLASGPARQRLAAFHAYPRYRYKMWPQEHWIALGQALAQRGYRIALTGSPDAGEMAYLAELATRLPPGTLNAAGPLTLGGSAYLVSRSTVYVGTDTAMTHIAAALGVPTVALFGPSNPVKWGPWPRGHAVERNPWRRCGSQRVANVALLQGAQACVPCLLEGCDRHIDSASDCLVHMPPEKVLAAIEAFEKDGTVAPL